MKSAMEGLLEIPVQDNSKNYISKYVSCIRINGKPILPPLLTPEKELEMASYRKLAVQVEKRLLRNRRDSMSSDGISAVETKSTPARPATLNLAKIKPIPSKSYRETIEHRLALESESDTESDRRRWSPLKVDSINDLRLQSGVDSDSAQETPDTVTASPRLLRQGSYTLLKPVSSLQTLIKSQTVSSMSPSKVTQHATAIPKSATSDDLYCSQNSRSHSGRKTWDLQQAKENWTSSREIESGSDESVPITPARSRNGGHMKRSRSYSSPRRVPSTDRVPSEISEPTVTVPTSVREQLGHLSEMMITLKLRHEQQLLQLQEMQAAEQKQYEQLFTFKQRQILQFLSASTAASTREPQSLPSSHTVRDDIASFASEPLRQVPVTPVHQNKKTSSLRVNYQNGRHLDEVSAQDTDLDVSIFEDICPPKDIGDRIETWSLSSRCSTISNEPVGDISTRKSNGTFLKYSYPDMERANIAASIINAGARGYLTRRLMETKQVQDLKRSLIDSINVCRTMKTSTDLGSSDLKFIGSLQRQIFSDWETLYDIFQKKDIIEQLEMISVDRERLRNQKKSQNLASGGRRMSAATLKSLHRKQKVMSTSLTVPPRSPSFKRSCFKMSHSLSGALPPTRSTCKLQLYYTCWSIILLGLYYLIFRWDRINTL